MAQHCPPVWLRFHPCHPVYAPLPIVAPVHRQSVTFTSQEAPAATADTDLYDGGGGSPPLLIVVFGIILLVAWTSEVFRRGYLVTMTVRRKVGTADVYGPPEVHTREL